MDLEALGTAWAPRLLSVMRIAAGLFLLGHALAKIFKFPVVPAFAKLDLKGQTVWQQYAPMASGVFAAGEDKKPTGQWGRDRFMPTNFAFLDDGGFLLADGYGSFYIHRYDKAGKWRRVEHVFDHGDEVDFRFRIR